MLQFINEIFFVTVGNSVTFLFISLLKICDPFFRYSDVI